MSTLNRLLNVTKEYSTTLSVDGTVGTLSGISCSNIQYINGFTGTLSINITDIGGSLDKVKTITFFVDQPVGGPWGIDFISTVATYSVPSSVIDASKRYHIIMDMNGTEFYGGQASDETGVALLMGVDP